VKEFALSDIRQLVQKGCALCQDMTAERADISVGAAEGFAGWNTIIVRTEIGDALANKAI
jgi:coenzyme F420 hydrogenase subunit beta